MTMLLLWVQEKAEQHIIAWFVGGLFVLLAVPLSIYDSECCIYAKPHAIA